MITWELILSCALLLMAALFVVINWMCVIASMRNKRNGIDRHHSTAPLVSLIIVVFFAYPLFPLEPKWWIGIIPALDIGNWMFIIGLPWAIAHGAFKKE